VAKEELGAMADRWTVAMRDTLSRLKAAAER